MLEDIQYETLTPMMQQWYCCKEKAHDAILLFRLGDFYEAFYEDAKRLAQALNLTLTKRCGIPMSGIPWHTSESYIQRLIQQGFKVAIAEQRQENQESKLFHREITEMITPGTFMGNHASIDPANHYIVAVTELGKLFGLCIIDISTGECKATEMPLLENLAVEMERIRPVEVITHKKYAHKYQSWLKSLSVLVTTVDDWLFEHQKAVAVIQQHFSVSHLDRFGLKGALAATNAVGGLIAYLQEHLNLPLMQVTTVQMYCIYDCLLLDPPTIDHLDLCEGTTSLLHVIDYTKTSMGSRLLKRWLLYPLVHTQEIIERYDALDTMRMGDIAALQELLDSIKDIERITMRIIAKGGNPKDVVALKESLKSIPLLIDKLASYTASSLLCRLQQQLDPIEDLVSLLEQALVEEPPLRLHEGGIFKEGYHPLLDEYRSFYTHGEEWIAQYQEQLRGSLQVKTLKVSFNKVFGYYIEVSKGQAHLIPDTFVKKQTLVNSERFISDELKNYEDKIFSIQEKIRALEVHLFEEIQQKVRQERTRIIANAQAVASVDVLVSLARLSLRHGFSRPVLEESKVLSIEQGRHPVVESYITTGSFVPNDTQLDDEITLMLITGPNMAGKSTYIRGVALMVLLAQMGSFVPAEKMVLGVVDRIFTRIGANDHLAAGQSTFMVEMSETAHILHHASDRSLVILDEIGRGTSTYDGVAIAWAVAEYLLRKGCSPRTLFATHYLELTALEQQCSKVVNYHAVCYEHQHKIVFLHQIKKGKADRSYGIHVAQLAGLPLPVITRAQEILQELHGRKKQTKKPESRQLTFI